MSCCKIPNGDKDLLGLYPFPVGKSTLNNIEIIRIHNGSLSCTSLGGSIFKQPVAKYFTRLTPDQIQEVPNKQQNHAQNKSTQSNDSDTKTSHKRIIGLQQNEASIVNTLPPAVLEEFSEVLENDLDSGDEDTLPDLNQQPKLHQLLTHQNFKLLEQILQELQHHNELKWSQWTVDDLFPTLLRNPHNLMKYCVVKDLEIIGRVLHSYTGCHFFSSSYNEAKNANLIGRAFEGNDLVEEMCQPIKNTVTSKPDSLVDLCKNKILQNEFLVQCLPVCYARVMHSIRKFDYMNECPVNMIAKIPQQISGRSEIQMELFVSRTGTKLRPEHCYSHRQMTSSQFNFAKQ